MEPAQQTLKLLLIEDSEDDAILLVRELEKSGFKLWVKRVASLQGLNEALASHPWDVIINDYNIPGFDSLHGLKTIRELDSDVPLIIVSGAIGEEVAVEAMRLGANDYIMKDKLTRLVPTVQRELAEAERRRALRQAEATIHHMAYHDSLTGLVNRVEFEQRLKHALNSAKTSDNHHVLLYLDLDQFKVINDTCGHMAGDELLRCLTIDLHRYVRSRDTLARLGGDEFGVLLDNCPLDRAKQIAESIRESVQQFRFVWEDKSFGVGVSIGLSVIDSNSRSVEEVLIAADMACYAAKDLGRNRIQLYSPDDANLNRRQVEMQWASRISQAVQDGRMLLYEHPIVALNGAGPINYREFLIRMVDDDGTIILPNAFIPAAERYNMMATVDRWVIEQVFRQLAGERNNSQHDQTDVVAFVNLSATSLSDEGLLEYIHNQLEENQITPEMICFEITETAAITDFANALKFINQIRRQGCRFALDDFGSGMSSFSYLKRIPIDIIKIDGGFVKNMCNDAMDREVVKAITQIAHVCGIKTVAEHVQNDKTMQMLQTIGVDFAQGHAIELPKASNTHFKNAAGIS